MGHQLWGVKKYCNSYRKKAVSSSLSFVHSLGPKLNEKKTKIETNVLYSVSIFFTPIPPIYLINSRGLSEHLQLFDCYVFSRRIMGATNALPKIHAATPMEQFDCIVSIYRHFSFAYIQGIAFWGENGLAGVCDTNDK